MSLLGSAGVQKFTGLPQLGATNDGVVDEQQALISNQLLHCNQLHACNQVALALDAWHKGARPGRGIFDKRAGERNPRLICIADGVCCTGIRYTRYCIHLNSTLVAAGKHRSAAVAHLFDSDTFIRGGRVAVVNPHKGTNLHLVARLHQRLCALRGNNSNLARTQLPFLLVAQVAVGKALE